MRSLQGLIFGLMSWAPTINVTIQTVPFVDNGTCSECLGAPLTQMLAAFLGAIDFCNLTHSFAVLAKLCFQ